MLESIGPDSAAGWALAAIGGFAGGFLNTFASAGSAVMLPLLMMIGLDPVTANATNRVPVLVGAASVTASFHRKKQIPWALALRAGLPATVGTILGAIAAELLPGRDIGLAIGAATLLALLLVFTRMKQILQGATTDSSMRFGPREIVVFFLIGLWLGFIVLDGPIFLLLALVLLVGSPLVPATSVKSAIMVPTTAVALAVFVWKDAIHWETGIAMAAGAALGSLLGARLVTSDRARAWIVRLMVLVIAAELVHLAIHYWYDTA